MEAASSAAATPVPGAPARGALLLGRKKRGFGAGKINGFGGKVEPGETILAGALRETAEEAGVMPRDARQVGVIRFDFLHAASAAATRSSGPAAAGAAAAEEAGGGEAFARAPSALSGAP
jgi:8-oxo-dGTP pyrophosphatase MutT (NUDIX family)